MTEKVRVLPEVGSVADLVRCLRNITDLYEELQGHPTASSREARAALRTQDSQSVNVGNNCSEDGQRIAGTDCGSGLVERLREFSTEWEKLAPRLAAARGGDLAEEAAEALAAAEAERDEAKRVFETTIDRAENQWKAWETRAREAEDRLAETQKKALEEAAQKADAFAVEPDPDEVDPYDDYEMGGRSTARSVAAAIRSISNKDAPK